MNIASKKIKRWKYAKFSRRIYLLKYRLYFATQDFLRLLFIRINWNNKIKRKTFIFIFQTDSFDFGWISKNRRKNLVLFLFVLSNELFMENFVLKFCRKMIGHIYNIEIQRFSTWWTLSILFVRTEVMESSYYNEKNCEF